jgi:hypothetical protein
METVIVRCRFFELDRPPGFQYFEIVGAIGGGVLGREQIMIRLADDVLVGEMKGPLELRIDLQIVALQILHKDQVRAVIQHALKPHIAFMQRVLHGAALSNFSA